MAYSRATSLLTVMLIFPSAAVLEDSCDHDMDENSSTSLLQVDHALSQDASAKERRYSEYPEKADWEADAAPTDYTSDIRAFLDKYPDLPSAFPNTLPRYTEAEASQVWLSVNGTVNPSEGSSFNMDITREWLGRLFQNSPSLIILTDNSNFDDHSRAMSKERLLQRIGDLQRLKQYVGSSVMADINYYPYLTMNLSSALDQNESYLKKEGTGRFMVFSSINDHQNLPIEDQAEVSKRINEDLSRSPLPTYALPLESDHGTFFVNGMARGAFMHVHPAVWHLATHGRKVWWTMGPKYTGGEIDPIKYGTENFGPAPNGCAYLSRVTPPEDATMFIQYEGETILVPDYHWHATCTLDEYSAATGGWLYDLCPGLREDYPAHPSCQSVQQ